MSIGYSHHLSERGPYEVKYYDTPELLWSIPYSRAKARCQRTTGVLRSSPVDSCGGWIGSAIDLTRAMTAIDGSRSGPFLLPATMTEFTADPGLPDWNTDPHYWYGLGIFVGPNPQTWYHGGSIEGTESQWLRDGNGYTWSIMTNSESQDPGRLSQDLDSTMLQALGSGLAGSSTDLYPQFVSPDLPPRTK
jgi:hypothetical protein